MYSEIIDCGEFDKMTKISVNLDKWDIDEGFRSDISFFIQRISSDKTFFLVFSTF